MELKEPQGVTKSLLKNIIYITTPDAPRMRSLVHAYFVRYELPRRAKEEADKVAQVETFAP